MIPQILNDIKEPKLRGVSLVKKILENQRKSHLESLELLKDSNSSLSKAIKSLSNKNA